MIKAVRGTRDLLPPETALWNFVEEAVRDVFRAYNFHEIRTPIFEETQLFARGVGEETDIVSKEMYTWEDRGRAASDKGQSLTLRPENTAGVVRAYIEHKLWDRGLTSSTTSARSSGASVRRRDATGSSIRSAQRSSGRRRRAANLRRATRKCWRCWRLCSTGSESPDWTLELNSVGCPNDRAAYNEALRKALEPVVAEHVRGLPAACCDQSAARVRLQSSGRSADHRNAAAHQPVSGRALPQALRAGAGNSESGRECRFTLNDRLVRGLDYYTRTAFEFTHGALGAQNAILGGGRYDGLSEALGGPAAPGNWFCHRRRPAGDGAAGVGGSGAAQARCLHRSAGRGNECEAARLARELRRHDVVVELGDETFRLKKSFETASKLGRAVHPDCGRERSQVRFVRGEKSGDR